MKQYNTAAKRNIIVKIKAKQKIPALWQHLM